MGFAGAERFYFNFHLRDIKIAYKHVMKHTRARTHARRQERTRTHARALTHKEQLIGFYK